MCSISCVLVIRENDSMRMRSELQGIAVSCRVLQCVPSFALSSSVKTRQSVKEYACVRESENDTEEGREEERGKN